MKMNGIMQKEQDDRKSCQKEKKKKAQWNSNIAKTCLTYPVDFGSWKLNCRPTVANKDSSRQGYGFSSGHVSM